MNSDNLVKLKEALLNYTKPILIKDLPSELYEGAIILCDDIDITQLNGHYEGIEFLPPLWFSKLEEKSKIESPILIINQINKQDKFEQTKFVEILKYKKISTFDLPINTKIIVTYIDNLTLSEEIKELTEKI